MSEHNPTNTALNASANPVVTDYESALDTEQTETKSNITITESAQSYLADLLSR